MSIYEYKEFRDAVDVSINNITKDYSRLKLLEKEYNRLKELVNLIVDQDIIDNSVTIKISKTHQVIGKSWREILELASKDM